MLSDKLLNSFLTNSQKIAINSFQEFLSSELKNVLIVKGSAGTGKTFLLKKFTELLEEQDLPFRVLTPTGKSAQILRSKAIIQASTIHSSIYSQDQIYEEESNGDFVYYFKLKSNQDSIRTIYLIDESSMISNKFVQDELLRFGTGYLLNDLITYISPSTSNRKKIVFFGDDNQLPPVNSSNSPALDKNYLESLSFNLKVDEIVLDEVVRQAKDSSINKNAILIKQYLEKKYFTSLKLEFDESEFLKINENNLIDDFCRRYKQDSKSLILIAYTNASVKKYNLAIRDNLFENPGLLEVNDRIIVTRNNSRYNLLNGDIGQIRWISPIFEVVKVSLKGEKEQQELRFRQVKIELSNAQNEIVEVSPLILENALINPESSITKKETRALLVDFVIRHKDIKRNSKEFTALLQNDPYVNCLLIKYGYAITCHKAQGGEWPFVYFDFNHPSPFSEGYFRYCYTGITRSKKIFFAINPPDSSIYQSGYKNSDYNRETEKVKSFPEENLYPDKLINIIREVLRSEKIEYRLESKPFRIRIKYFIENKPVHTDIIYKKDGKISTVQSNDTSEKNTIFNSLIPLITGEEISDEDVISSNPFLEELKKDIKNRLSRSGVEIQKIVHFNYQERYFFCFEDQGCSINIYYNSKNRITNILPHKGSKLLITKIMGLLNE